MPTATVSTPWGPSAQWAMRLREAQPLTQGSPAAGWSSGHLLILPFLASFFHLQHAGVDLYAGGQVCIG